MNPGNVVNNRSRMLSIVMVVLGSALIFGSAMWYASSKKPQPTPTPTSTAIARRIPYPNIKRVSLADAKAAFDTKQAVFIDVRGEPSFSEGHIPGAISITEDELPARLNELNKNTWYIIYCT